MSLVAAPPLEHAALIPTRTARGAGVPAGARARASLLRQRCDGVRHDLARRRALRGRARRHRRGRPGLGLGAAGRARRPVSAARGVRRARLRVSDRGRRVPMEPPSDGRRLRLAQRLGGDLRLRGGQHDDRLPRRSLGAHSGRHHADPECDRGDRDGSRHRLRDRRRTRDRRARPCDQSGHRRRDRRVGRDRTGAPARLPKAGRLHPHADARRRGALGWIRRRRHARSPCRRRLGVHRLRRLRRRLRGDERRGAPRSSRDLVRTAQRRSGGHAQCLRRRARAPEPRRHRRRARRRSGLDRGRQLVRDLGRPSRSRPSCSRRSWPAAWLPRR